MKSSSSIVFGLRRKELRPELVEVVAFFMPDAEDRRVRREIDTDLVESTRDRFLTEDWTWIQIEQFHIVMALDDTIKMAMQDMLLRIEAQIKSGGRLRGLE